ncbi:MAG: single-stranded-DNA-specific exonuclease RecJ [Anaerolineae bacterium]|nr:single-stranded-DNA-specific exonuclease RecJ [Anaerolineae bacterium]
MSTLSKRWLVATPAASEILAAYRGIHPVLAQTLYNRGFTEPDEARRFLEAHNENTNPFLMKGVNLAVARIRQAIMNHEQIVVYGDFDADGVTSTALMVQTLTALNALVKPYIPHRVDEGYGLNSQALVKLAQAGAKLIITVDCGIRSVEDVEAGKTAGLDIIITDHHSIGPEIPNAYAVINPKQEDCKYPEDMLAGVGVAYKLADALLRAAKQDRPAPRLEVEELLDLVAIGTVADLAPMNRIENRALVRHGLAVLSRANRPGIRALLEVSGVKPAGITSMNIGFSLGPRINAAGRLESAMIAYNLLAANDYDEALKLAEQLQQLNNQRQDLTRSAQEVVRGSVESQKSDLPLIFASGHFQPGIVGLVAGRLTEEYFRPTVIMEEGETESRASCRSIPQFDITRALDQCADLLVRHGGHAQAAGFTVLNQNIPALKQRLVQLATDRLAGQELLPTLEIDAETDIHHLSESLVTEMLLLEPTGYHNPTPVLMSRNVRVLESRGVGKESQHLKLKLARAGQPPLDAIGFGLGGWLENMPDRIDVAYQLEINEWNGHRNLQLNLQDIRSSRG